MRHSIVILISWFGPWPEWIDFFVESCRRNPTIDWIIFTDAGAPENRARNVQFIQMSLAEYSAHVSEALGIRFEPTDAYKLCDIRPAIGEIHRDLIRGYDFFGFGDIDLIYGDIRATYDAELLDTYDALSTHPDRVSGHLFLMRNREELITGFRQISNWRRKMQAAHHTGFDEREFYSLFRGPKTKLLALLGKKPLRALFREAYTTPVATTGMRWYWRKGRLTNQYYPHRDFIYLHFMSWRSSRWYSHRKLVVPGAAPPWSRLPKIVQIDWREARKNGFMISPDGIGPIEDVHYE